MIEWERHAADNYETLVIKCDECGAKIVTVVQAEAISDWLCRSEMAHRVMRRHGYERVGGNLYDACSTCVEELTTETKRENETLRAAIVHHDRELRFRAAMQGMANVMSGVAASLIDLSHLVENMRSDGELRHTFLLQATKEAASREWSRRVREGVKRIAPPGPRVYCQHEED